MIAPLATALLLSGCVIPYQECTQRPVSPRTVQAVRLQPGENPRPGAGMSLIFGRLTVTAPSKTVQELKWPLLKVDDEAGLGITQDRLVPGEDFYLIVPSGRYLVRRTDYYVEPVVDASFDVPTSPGAYYLGTLAVTVEGPYLGKIAGAEVIDEFGRAVGELRERNPGFAALAKKQLMKTLGPQKDLSFSEEHCQWEVCLIGSSVSYCPVD